MSIERYAALHRDRFVEELSAYCRIPSVAAAGTGLDDACQWVSDRLARLGAEVRRLHVSSSRAPAVLATTGPADAERTLLIYNHYDVQPPEPLEAWLDPPFEPTVRDGRLFARGVADNKANLLSRVHAVEALRATRGDVPLRILWLVEGEEEIGSPSLANVAADHGSRWSDADGCLWEAGYKDEAGRHVLYSGLKGLAGFELTARGAAADSHSAMATLLPNAAWRLVWALGTLKASDETIRIAGLMDHVRPPTPAERAFVEAIPFDERDLCDTHGVPQLLTGVSGTDALLRHLYQPTCTITGLESGYTGPDMKTVLPARARAKVGFRLVPELTPSIVADTLRTHLDRGGFEDIEIESLVGERPAPGQVDSDVVRAALAAARDVSGREAILWPHMVGTGPMYEVCTQFGIPTVGFGTGNHASNVHAPNENVRLDDYLEGVAMAARFYERFAG